MLCRKHGEASVNVRLKTERTARGWGQRTCSFFVRFSFASLLNACAGYAQVLLRSDDVGNSLCTTWQQIWPARESANRRFNGWERAVSVSPRCATGRNGNKQHGACGCHRDLRLLFSTRHRIDTHVPKGEARSQDPTSEGPRSCCAFAGQGARRWWSLDSACLKLRMCNETVATQIKLLHAAAPICVTTGMHDLSSLCL